MTDVTAPARTERTFFGQPRGLAYLAFTEAWERFSFYGMSALLVLYMTQQLLLPGHVENIAGFAAFRGALESAFGPMTTIGLASQINGLYGGLVYLTPVFGGIIADRWLGKRNAVAIGAVLMSAGHVAMAFDQSFLLALLLLVTGSGLLKGNISAQVGALYAEGDGPGRTRGFAIFSVAINAGALGGPLLCGLLAQVYGWHIGFGLAGAMMLIGLATYLIGYNTLTENAAAVSAAPSAAPEKLTSAQKRAFAALFLVMALSVFQTIAYIQSSNIGLVWIDEHVNRTFLGFDIPVAWFYALDGFACIVFVPFLFALWRWQQKNGGEPGEVTKIATGAWIATASTLLIVAAIFTAERPWGIWPALSVMLFGVAFLYQWPTLLALVSLSSPPKLRSTMMGIVFLTIFIAAMIMGRLGSLYEPLGPAAFFALHAGISAIGAVLATLLAAPLQRTIRAAQS